MVRYWEGIRSEDGEIRAPRGELDIKVCKKM